MSIDTGYSVLREVLADNPQGWAIEFGVYSGASLSMIAQRMPVIGLDSFEGLPEDWREGFPRGSFTPVDDLGLPRPGTYITPPPMNAMLVQGWFQDSLAVLRERGLPKFGLVHIDCDLYSSTVMALDGIADSIGEGTWIVFDEFHNYPGWEDHEALAWTEFCVKQRVLVDAMIERPGQQEVAFRIGSLRKARR